ncbi:MAG: hypothetical protein PHP44_08400 [Kiritimatiellae bacterium]|nr:hypothetical protein [Kiritimatiellia bacterium]
MCRKHVWSIFFFSLFVAAAQAQWMRQTVTLTNGWNAVYLAVQPYPQDLDSQLAGLPIRAVHRCARVFSVEQFSSATNSPLDRAAEWLVWYPPDSPHHVVNTLSAFLGGTAYLIECYEDQAVWTVTGYPVAPQHTWVPEALNFLGMPVNATNEPAFASFFRGASGIDLTPDPNGGKVFEVLPSGEQLDVSSQTATYKMEAGRAYWIWAEGISDYTGPIKVHAPLAGLHFTGDRPLLSFSVRNDSATNRAVSIRLTASAPPPAGMPSKIGDVPLLHFNQADGGAYGWVPFTRDSVLNTTLAVGGEEVFTLAADRSGMSDHGTNAAWQSLIEVTDDAGTLVRLPVSAVWSEDNPYNALWPEGLWVGSVSVTGVAYVAANGVTAPQPVSSPFTFRLIVHQGSDGVLRLLQQVVMAWDTVNERYDLWVSNAVPTTVEEASRVSSAVFPPRLNVVMSGNLLSVCSATFAIGAEDPCNPWRHVFSPSHNTADDALSITNTITLTPDAPEENMNGAALWKPEEYMEGTFVQEIRGLRKQAVTVSGTYEIKRVGKVGFVR